MWVVIRTILSRPSCRIYSRRRTRSSGSSPAVGSSSSRTLGAPSRAWASITRWRMPPEKPPTRRWAASHRFTTCSSSRSCSLAARGLSPFNWAMYSRNSQAVMSSYIPWLWGMKPSTCRNAGPMDRMSVPSKAMVPTWRGSRSQIRWMRVLFPAPLGPSRAVMPGVKVWVKPVRAFLSP